VGEVGEVGETGEALLVFIGYSGFSALLTGAFVWCISIVDISTKVIEDEARMTQPPADHLPLTPAVLHILLALAGGEMHGYAMMREVDQLSGGTIRLGPGTLYRSIKRLLDDKLIEEAGERQDPALDDDRRRYYRLTALGGQVLALETDRLERLLAAARQRHTSERAVRLETRGA
jgi:DNA-binding PadR family transcriptional regulator